MLCPLLHTLSDGLEWAQGGFSPLQLGVSACAFLPIPAVMLGLYAAQRPRISAVGLLGAVGYGFAFVYFTHTALLALAIQSPDYQQLWGELGVTYTLFGVLMIGAGLAFGLATLRARVFPAWTAQLFLIGLSLNLVLALFPIPEMVQTLGSLLRNIGLLGMGWALARQPSGLPGVHRSAP
ncbi:hypothetical protein [Cyanobium sp. NIES-981]|uniref:hypothetical protein n=1 Tax=Cyanobium sp. NIES-981 TaxID=1851505 RepID=UPI0012F8BC77|nr:hypothetical protein [Cyanobium sp. NIES-981]